MRMHLLQRVCEARHSRFNPAKLNILEMARYTGPKTKIARRFAEPIFGPSKALNKKNYPPGQHGRGRRKKQSEYAIQLMEKQKVKYMYGVLEKQFENLFHKAAALPGITGDNLLALLESRLDNTVYRLGVVPPAPIPPVARFRRLPDSAG